jgi:hypothetical protein
MLGSSVPALAATFIRSLMLTDYHSAQRTTAHFTLLNLFHVMGLYTECAVVRCALCFSLLGPPSFALPIYRQSAPPKLF